MIPISVADWPIDSSFSPYPEGSRAKYALFASDRPADGIVPNHRYLMKFSNPRYPVQFWSELLAFEIARHLKVPAPPTFVAIDPKTGNPGSLSEWFYGPLVEGAVVGKTYLAKLANIVAGVFVEKPDIPESHSLYVPGSNYMARRIQNYDFKKGKQHNLIDIAVMIELFSRTFSLNYWNHWARILMFDCLIGNTDRHQDNWGTLWRRNDNGDLIPRFSPAFDNGTSLLHEITDENIGKFASKDFVDRYIARGRHHMRWKRDDEKQAGHLELIRKLVAFRPQTLAAVVEMLDVDPQKIWASLVALCSIDCPVPLTNLRLEAIFSVMVRRIELLRAEFS